jgi:hypothetical protein
MYNALTSTYTFACPRERAAKVHLSDFRVLERLPGAAHPCVYHVSFACSCGDEHTGLVSHDDLDVAPLGMSERALFRDLMTARDVPTGVELLEIAAVRIGAGEWPWSFFCFLEGQPRPMTPSALLLIAPGGPSLGMAARCPSCSSVSVNIVTRAHLDIPFWNDAHVRVVDHVFDYDAVRTLDEFRAELDSARFDERRLDLER